MKETENSRTILIVQRCLLFGVLMSGVMCIVGLVKVLATNQQRPEGLPPSFTSLIAGLPQFDGLSFLYLGLLMLMSTPVIRVAALSLSWFAEGERRFGAVALGVLCLLGLSIFFGVAE